MATTGKRATETQGDAAMTCKSCRYSMDTSVGLLTCTLLGQLARQRCHCFVYEPGTDEDER